MKRQFFTLMLLSGSIFTLAQEVPMLNPSNADAVLKAMTLEEKIQLVVGYNDGTGYSGLPTQAPEGATQILPGAAGETAYIPRLGITQTVLADGPAGLRISPTRRGSEKTYYCTAFPTSTLLASSWDSNLVRRVGEAMGNEVLEYGADVLLAPGINIMRNPLCGRNFEYYSEDPLVAGRLSSAMIQGIQSQGVGVSLKHFAANNQEGNRMGNDAVISQRALREIYLKPFEIAIKEAKPWTVMSSYNKINGTFTQESKDLLTTILRKEWGFQGIVMTDWTDTRNTAAQIKAGNDLMEPGYQPQVDDLKKALKEGRLSEADLDLCVKRILQFIVKTPRFKNYKYSDSPDLQAHAQVTRDAAAQGMVLLKNNKAQLPLQKGRRIALFGVTSYNLVSGGTGSGDVNEAYVVGLDEGMKNVGFKLDGTLAANYKDYIQFQNGLSRTMAGFRKAATVSDATRMLEPSLNSDIYFATSQKDDAAVITIGRNSGEGADRQVDGDFNLRTDERELIEQVCEAFHKEGKPVIVIINTGGVIETASWKALPDAILMAWQPGQEGGNSIADILVGKVNPSGKLPVTFPQKYTDHASASNFPQHYSFNDEYELTAEQKEVIPHIGTTYYEEGVYVGYRYFTTSQTEVSYPFGYGLSYTSFGYSNPKIAHKGHKYVAQITITNKGIRAGREVVQLYVQSPEGTQERPERELKAFAKTRELQPGESETVTLEFQDMDLAYYNESTDEWQVVAGKYNALIGASSQDIRQTLAFTASAQSQQCNDALAPVKPLHEISLKPVIETGNEVSEEKEMEGNWFMAMNIMGHDIKGAVELKHDAEGWWSIMNGERQRMEIQDDGSLKGSSDQGGFTTTFYIIPLNKNQLKMTMIIIGQEFTCTMERVD